MGIENASSIGMPGLGISGSISSPEISASSSSVGGQTDSQAAFQLAFNFGSEHQVTGESFFLDRAVPAPEIVFNDKLFAISAQSLEPPVVENNVLPDITPSGIDLQIAETEQISQSFPEISDDASLVDLPVFIEEKLGIEPKTEPFPIFESKPEAVLNIAQDVDASSFVEVNMGVEEEKALAEVRNQIEELKKLNSAQTKKTQNIDRVVKTIEEHIPSEEKTAWEILSGQIPRGDHQGVEPLQNNKVVDESTAPEEEISSEEPEVTTQTTDEGGVGRVGIIQTNSEEDHDEETDEPKEPLWKISGRVEGKETVDKSSLERRIGVAKEIVQESAKEMTQEQVGNRYRLASRIVTRLGKIDIPTLFEGAKMILGYLDFSLVAGKAGREIDKLSASQITPERVFGVLHRILLKYPSLNPRKGKMEDKGVLPQGKLKILNKKVEALAGGGAQHIIYDSRMSDWFEVDEKPSRYPLEADKTDKLIPVNADEGEIFVSAS